jgi:EmrB/QacA subfamily drug resistance transporter
MERPMLVVDLSPRAKAVVIVGTMLGLLVAAISQTVVSTALPRIIGDLGGLNLFSWVFTASMLTSTTIVPLVGKLSDLYGRKPFFIGGIVIFMITSALAGLSQSMVQLIIFRGFQGIGAGMLMANAFAIIGDLFPASERGRYMGLFSAVFGLASVVGPLLGGWLTDNLSWRWVFYVNLPVGVVALSVLMVGFPWVRPRGDRPPMDYWGVSALILAVVPLLLALVWAGDLYPWVSPQIAGLLAMAVVGAVAFVLVERAAADPIMPLGMFGSPVFSVAIVITFLTGMGMFGAITFTPMFIQGALGSSATNSGLVTMPMMLGMVVASTTAGQLITRTGRYRVLVVLSGIVLAAGMYLMSRMDEGTAHMVTVRNMIIVGTGLGISMPILGLVVQNAMPYRLLGVATSSVQFFRQIGGTLGIAIFGTLVTTHLRDNLRAELPADVQSLPEPVLERLEDPQVLLSPESLDRLRESFAALGAQGAALFAETIDSMRMVLAEAITNVFFLSMVLSIAALAVSFFLREVPLRTTVDGGEGAWPRPAPPAGEAVGGQIPGVPLADPPCAGPPGDEPE